MKRKIVVGGAIAAIGLLVSGGGYAAWYQSDTEVAKRQVLDRLVDPDSAKFDDVKSCSYEGSKAVVGSVNSRNTMGGMTGKKTFVVEWSSGDNTYTSIAGVGVHNIADSFDDESINAKTNMDCGRLYKTASDHLNSNSRSDGSPIEMNATDGMDIVAESTDLPAIDNLEGIDP